MPVDAFHCKIATLNKPKIRKTRFQKPAETGNAGCLPPVARTNCRAKNRTPRFTESGLVFRTLFCCSLLYHSTLQNEAKRLFLAFSADFRTVPLGLFSTCALVPSRSGRPRPLFQSSYPAPETAPCAYERGTICFQNPAKCLPIFGRIRNVTGKFYNAYGKFRYVKIVLPRQNHPVDGGLT